MKPSVESQFNYCSLTRMFHWRRLNNKINSAHEKAIRVVYSDYKSVFQELLVKEAQKHPCATSRAFLKFTKHVAASKPYKIKLVILTSFYVSMSPRLPLQAFKQKLGSEVKNQDKQSPSRKHCFSKLKCRQFLYKTSSLYILSNCYTS